MRTHPWRTFTAAVALVAVLGACSSSSGTSTSAAGGGTDTQSAGSGASAVKAGSLYDSSIVHDIEVTFDQAAYNAMVDTYASSRDKDWIEATVTIDGTTIKRVGMRLKGNSSLMGLAARGGGGGRVGGNSTGTRETPQSLPWLIRLDKYVDGQDYQGHTELVVRGNTSATSLNEAVALELIGLAGAATQDAFATRFSVNGGPEVLRLAIENPNDEWEEANFDTDGILYKAESTGDYSYRGDSPASYDEVFDQETDTDTENLTPLITFLKFINQSTDAQFAVDLGKYLDVNAFAKYLALQDLVQNWDDIDGPGNNSYLRYDEKTKQMTVLSWDLNLSFGRGPGGGGGAPGAAGAAPGAPGAGGAGGAAAAPPVPPGGGQMPAGGPGGGGAQGPMGARAGGPGGRSNILVTRFQANAQFAALYEQAKTNLKADLFTSGKAASVLSTWSEVLKANASDLVPVATIESEAAGISRFFV